MVNVYSSDNNIYMGIARDGERNGNVGSTRTWNETNVNWSRVNIVTKMASYLRNVRACFHKGKKWNRTSLLVPLQGTVNEIQTLVTYQKRTIIKLHKPWVINDEVERWNRIVEATWRETWAWQLARIEKTTLLFLWAFILSSMAWSMPGNNQSEMAKCSFRTRHCRHLATGGLDTIVLLSRLNVHACQCDDWSNQVGVHLLIM